MKWWPIRKRDADLERELRSDLELEEEEQRENGPVTRRGPLCGPPRLRQSRSHSRADPRRLVLELA